MEKQEYWLFETADRCPCQGDHIAYCQASGTSQPCDGIFWVECPTLGGPFRLKLRYIGHQEGRPQNAAPIVSPPEKRTKVEQEGKWSKKLRPFMVSMVLLVLISVAKVVLFGAAPQEDTKSLLSQEIYFRMENTVGIDGTVSPNSMLFLNGKVAGFRCKKQFSGLSMNELLDRWVEAGGEQPPEALYDLFLLDSFDAAQRRLAMNLLEQVIPRPPQFAKND